MLKDGMFIPTSTLIELDKALIADKKFDEARQEHCLTAFNIAVEHKPITTRIRMVGQGLRSGMGLGLLMSIPACAVTFSAGTASGAAGAFAMFSVSTLLMTGSSIVSCFNNKAIISCEKSSAVEKFLKTLSKDEVNSINENVIKHLKVSRPL